MPTADPLPTFGKDNPQNQQLGFAEWAQDQLSTDAHPVPAVFRRWKESFVRNIPFRNADNVLSR